jgi:hypothetical protein
MFSLIYFTYGKRVFLSFLWYLCSVFQHDPLEVIHLRLIISVAYGRNIKTNQLYS